MRILHVTSDWKWTGPAEPMLHAVTGLRERGHVCDVACPIEPDGAGQGLWTRVRERGVDPGEPLRALQGYRPWRDRRDVEHLRRRIAEGGYDVVHTHHTRDVILCRSALRGSKTLHVVSWHRGEPVPSRLIERGLWGPGALAGLTVLCREIAEGAERSLGWQPERLLELPGVVDAARFRPRPAEAALRKELGLEPGHRVVGVVARLQPHRRFDLLLDAVERIRHEVPALRVLVVGRGTKAREVLEQPVAERGLGDVVLRAGYRREDYAQVLALLHGLLFLVPGSDGSCRAVLEAMAMQIPIIATRRGVLPELVQDRETGRLVDETPESLAAALQDLALASSDWVEWGRAARRRVLERHRVEQHAERLEGFYSSLLAARA